MFVCARSGLLFAILALVIDVGNIWNNSLHVQLAAEAAALAGVPYMPGDFTTASSLAVAEAGGTASRPSTGATVTPAINTESNRRLDVTVSRTYGTYFLRRPRHEDGADHPDGDRRVHAAGARWAAR